MNELQPLTEHEMVLSRKQAEALRGQFLNAKALVALCSGIAMNHGTLLCADPMLHPLEIEKASKGDLFVRGVLCCLAEIAIFLNKTVDGRQALLDLFPQPVQKDVERPGGSGGND
jgi:hypothetical protein